ncbi:hypothetical protein KC959_00695 [Candidatus Saccharibacteria bacterium]|nr:hypothetical protein [Candidatus Saccharibacteria bacterium]
MVDKISLVLCVVILYVLIDLKKAKPSSAKTAHSVVMDTSALIDGRVVDVVKSGFLQRKIIVPKVVLRELQLLADGRDPHKRERARLGLDMVKELQSVKGVTVAVDSYRQNSTQATDEILIQLAKSRKAVLCTTDFNLNKVADSEGITVLNVNELAQVMRPKILPGELIEVKVIQKGEGRGQGVGYLEDGTMVVIENTTPKMRNTKVSASVERMIQTKAGKMVFARFETDKKTRN